MTNRIEVDVESRQQIAKVAGVLSAIAVLIASVNSDSAHQINPLAVAIVTYIVAFAGSLVSKAFGIVAIGCASVALLQMCGVS